ncbi:hypothetical protein RRG08_036182 [Elysia crispata]|uniref:Uncharacterized protein n=1 Tax=Elysia crispata TaxID=231223 RepID=A0AAE0XET9_9GAST|nr:hypothetical protein RRG08_036182 [Elysia crispata]
MAEFSDREQCERRAESESISELRKLQNSQATGFALGSIKALQSFSVSSPSRSQISEQKAAGTSSLTVRLTTHRPTFASSHEQRTGYSHIKPLDRRENILLYESQSYLLEKLREGFHRVPLPARLYHRDQTTIQTDPQIFQAGSHLHSTQRPLTSDN